MYNCCQWLRKDRSRRRAAVYEVCWLHVISMTYMHEDEEEESEPHDKIYLPGLGMFSLLFRRRLEFDEAARSRRDISPLELEMYKRAIRRELLDRRRHAATCATLCCILVCGSLMLSLGIALTCTGVLVPRMQKNPSPWLVTGPTCIVIGVLILLLSVEICMKKKKVAIDDLGTGKKKPPEEDPSIKVKSLPIWRGMDRAENKHGQGGYNKVGCETTTPVHPVVSVTATSMTLVLDASMLESTKEVSSGLPIT